MSEIVYHKSTGNDKGTIYLLHFSKPYYHARHYLGYTDNLEARIARHKAGNGSPLVAAVVNSDIDIVVARTWNGDRNLERRLKNRKNTPRQLCPLCRSKQHDQND